MIQESVVSKRVKMLIGDAVITPYDLLRLNIVFNLDLDANETERVPLAVRSTPPEVGINRQRAGGHQSFLLMLECADGLRGDYGAFRRTFSSILVDFRLQDRSRTAQSHR